MARLVNANTNLDAWMAVSRALLGGSRAEQNVLIEIANPILFDEAWVARFNPADVVAQGDQIRDVANTIFPRKTFQNSPDRHGAYERYKRAHARSRHRRWGTYFLRLIAFGQKQSNQLEAIINALDRWRNTPHAALTLHLSSPETDTLRPLGAPCWHFGEFLCPDHETVELVAVYRNHDYFNKALGNFIGLGRLLEFVANETGRRPGRLVCHSVRAYFDVSKANMASLLAR